MATTKQRFKQLAGLLKEAVLTEQVQYTIEEEAQELFQSIEESQRMLRRLRNTIGTNNLLDDRFDLHGIEAHLNDAANAAMQVIEAEESKSNDSWKSEVDDERREKYLTDASEFVSVLEQYGIGDDQMDDSQAMYDGLVEDGYVDEEDSNSVGAAEEAIEEFQSNNSPY